MSDETPVRLEAHTDRWREHFEEEGVVLLEAFADSARDIEHIGSTAIPDLPARPVVDIMVGVDALEVVGRHVVALQELDYEYLGEADVPERRFFRKRNDKAFDVWVVLHGGEHWQRNLRLRNYLQNHPDEAERVAERKREIAEEADSRDEYAARKSELFEEILEAAAI